MNIRCKMLTESDEPDILRTMVSGFSKYLIKIDIDEDGYRQKFALDGVEYESSVGVFDDDKMIGVTMNGVGDWNGHKTLYDAGTVVIPEYRGKGVSTRMFDYQLPLLREQGFENYLLEVIRENEPALKLYERFGFKTTRELGVFYKDNQHKNISAPGGLETREMTFETMEASRLLAEEGVAWQNSQVWMRRSELTSYGLVYLGLYKKDEIVGVGVVSPRSGKVLRIHVVEDYRRNGCGSYILNELQKYTAKPLVFLNQDLADTDNVKFLESAGSVNKVTQFEMERGF